MNGQPGTQWPWGRMKSIQHRIHQHDPQDCPEGQQETGIQQIQGLPQHHHCRGGGQAGGQIVGPSGHVRSDPHQKHDQRPQAGHPPPDHQRIEHQKQDSGKTRLQK